MRPIEDSFKVYADHSFSSRIAAEKEIFILSILWYLKMKRVGILAIPLKQKN